MLSDKTKIIVLTDKELISASLKNDIKSQKALFDKYKNSMKALCYRYTGNNEDAEDVLQEGFILVFSKLKNYKFEGSFEGWIRKIMINVALKYIKKKNKFYTEDIKTVYDLYDKNQDAISDMSSNELLNLLIQLPDGYRTVFNMYVIEGFSHKEIGQTLKIAESSSRSQLAKAKNMLRDLVTKLYSDNG